MTRPGNRPGPAGRVRETSGTPSPARGRPVATTHAQIEEAAFGLFARHGFNDTTLQMIAQEVGVGRRTLFRYFESKNDIPWGQFARSLDGFRTLLDEAPADVPLAEAIHGAVLAFNTFDADSRPPHRERMRLILETPALQAHSALRYTEWREVIAEYVAKRLSLAATDLLPQSVGHASLAIALSAYEAWLRDPGADLLALLDQAMSGLRWYLRAS